MKFEWDEGKNQKNIKNHKVSFEKAIGVFLDKERIEKYDSEHSQEEDRYIVIGLNGKILFVVYTERGENNEIIRIISARKATKEEQDEYNKNRSV